MENGTVLHIAPTNIDTVKFVILNKKKLSGKALNKVYLQFMLQSLSGR